MANVQITRHTTWTSGPRVEPPPPRPPAPPARRHVRKHVLPLVIYKLSLHLSAAARHILPTEACSSGRTPKKPLRPSMGLPSTAALSEVQTPRTTGHAVTQVHLPHPTRASVALSGVSATRDAPCLRTAMRRRRRGATESRHAGSMFSSLATSRRPLPQPGLGKRVQRTPHGYPEL